MNISEALVREIVEKVVQTMLANPSGQPDADDFTKCKDPSGVLMVKTDTVRCEPFGGVPGVALKDIVTLQEAPRMGAGIMELDHGAQFEWTLNYDESSISSLMATLGDQNRQPLYPRAMWRHHLHSQRQPHLFCHARPRPLRLFRLSG